MVTCLGKSYHFLGKCFHFWGSMITLGWPQFTMSNPPNKSWQGWDPPPSWQCQDFHGFCCDHPSLNSSTIVIWSSKWVKFGGNVTIDEQLASWKPLADKTESIRGSVLVATNIIPSPVSLHLHTVLVGSSSTAWSSWLVWSPVGGESSPQRGTISPQKGALSGWVAEPDVSLLSTRERRYSSLLCRGGDCGKALVSCSHAPGGRIWPTALPRP